MKLHLTAQSERGKPITKSGNEYVEVKILNENRETIAIISFDSKKFAIMSIREDIEVDMRQMSKPKTDKCDGCKARNMQFCNHKPKTARERNCEHLYRDASDKRYCVDCGKKM